MLTEVCAFDTNDSIKFPISSSVLEFYFSNKRKENKNYYKK